MIPRGIMHQPCKRQKKKKNSDLELPNWLVWTVFIYCMTKMFYAQSKCANCSKYSLLQAEHLFSDLMNHLSAVKIKYIYIFSKEPQYWTSHICILKNKAPKSTQHVLIWKILLSVGTGCNICKSYQVWTIKSKQA